MKSELWQTGSAWLLLCGLLLSLPAPVLAQAGDQAKMNISISGTVVANGSCTFNAGSGTSLGVEFGPVSYSQINGFTLEGQYRKPLNSAMTCSGDTDGNPVMTFSASDDGVQVSGKNKLLPVYLNGKRTNNMGIELWVNGKLQNVGEAFSVDMASPPELEAELVQTASSDKIANGAILMSGATLVMAFQ